MKKKLAVLLLVPALMLSGCSMLNNILGKLTSMVDEQSQKEEDAEDQKEYAQTVKIDDSKKGSPVSYEEARQTANEINAEVQLRAALVETEEGVQQVIEDTDKFSYQFKVKMDDEYILDKVNYSRSDAYFSSILDERIPVEHENQKYISTGHTEIYDYLDGRSGDCVQAVKHNYNGYREDDSGVWGPYDSHSAYYRYVPLSTFDSDIFTQLSELIVSIGNQGKNYMQSLDPYFNETYQGFGEVTLQYCSKGAGHLYGKIDIPTIGVTFEFLFENYWITYEYMHVDMRKLQTYVDYDLGTSYKQMSTELYMNFDTVNLSYPDLSGYQEYTR